MQLEKGYLEQSMSRHTTHGRCASSRYFHAIGALHDIESYGGVENALSVNQHLFIAHWGHLSVILLWVCGNLFHISWNGNYELFLLNPISSLPIAHGLWDPHFGTGSYATGHYTVIAFSGIYNWLLAAGFKNVGMIYNFVLGIQELAGVSLILAKVHNILTCELSTWLRFKSVLDYDDSIDRATTALGPLDIHISPTLVSAFMSNNGLRLNSHLGLLFGLTSIGWCGHLVHVSIPVSRGASGGLLIDTPYPAVGTLYPAAGTLYPAAGTLYPAAGTLYPDASLASGQLALNCDRDNHVFGSAVGSGSALLTFLGGLKSDTASLYLTDIAHHHLALGVVLVWASHLYSSLYKGLGHRIRDVIVSGHEGLTVIGRSIVYLSSSLQLQLCLALGGLSLVTSVVAQHVYSLTAYPYLEYDYVTTLALYVHHSWIAGFLMMGAFAHSAIFLIRDYTADSGRTDVIFQVIQHKAAIISHLSWVTLWLGFHTLGLYIHNDTVSAFSAIDCSILIEPWTNISGGVSYSLADKPFGSLVSPVGPGDVLVNHAISLGLHLTVLITLKGSLDGPGSKLMPDKVHFGYGFSCDGPGRGGTCDLSAWDSFYLAMFWMLNTNAWMMFYFHWKQLVNWNNSGVRTSPFDESSTYLNGWFRDYLWFYSADLIRGYDALGANDLSVWSWSFLAAHLCWAVSFMFLISWRGFWQELIDIILLMHLKTPIVYDLWDGGVYTPVALSILQARFVGLVHFAVGFILTYAAFLISGNS